MTFSRILKIALFSATLAAAQNVTTPSQFFGFQLGADGKMARWDKIVEYYSVLEKESGGKMKVTNMGPSTMGNPFLMVVITSPANHAKLEHLRQVNLQISDSRGLAEAQVKGLVAEGKVFCVQSMSLHASEIGGSQMAPELAYDLISRNDEETKRILENVVFIEVPSFNPDGQIMVTDWYRESVGKAWEGTSTPWLYHKYVGHDNNRDAFMTQQVESKYMAKLLFTDWRPESYVDHHHMGSYGARIYLPPYAEPVRPYADPLTWRELSWYGAHMAYKEEEGGMSGVFNMGEYSGWGHFGFHWITPFHNIAGMLTESASAKMASPLYIHPEQLQGNVRNLPKYEEETVFPDPWPGGWWRLRDIVERQKISAWAVLDISARNRETVLWNAYLKGKRQTERGAAGKPYAYIVSANQHDPLTADLMIDKLLVQGIEIHQTTKPFSASTGVDYPAGSFVISLAQPKMGLIKNLLGRTFFPDNYWTRNGDGTPIRPYDMSTDTMDEFMGVRTDALDEPVNVAEMKKLTGPVSAAGKVSEGSVGSVIDGRLNNAFKAVNELLAAGAQVSRVDKAQGSLRAGDFIVAKGASAAPVAKDTGVSFLALNAAPRAGSTHPVKKLRIGLRQRYSGGNIDEGWTRWLMEDFKFPYTSLMDKDFKAGNLIDQYDVIVIPDDSIAMITGQAPAGGGRGGRGGGGGGGGFGGGENYPPEYRAGIGNEGVTALKEFVNKGGTLVALGGASEFAIEQFNLGLRNALANLNTKEFWCPGSTLRLDIDNTQPPAYGMPSRAFGVFLQGNMAFDLSNAANENYYVVARYADREILQSGWLVGEQNLSKKAAMVTAAVGKGRVIVVGFRTQHRAQTYGTFKLLFNTLIG
ncbi:MAG TPA: M14 metallopeptidase family protein [Bryobacteraceae bacterium]|nr:M14 metallopeptidase family protein [Bryobacteraceae bacterium]